MFSIILMVCCVLINIYVINCDDNITVKISAPNNCSIQRSEYTFNDGQRVTLVLNNKQHVNFGHVRVLADSGTNIDDYFKYTKNITIIQQYAGTWEFKFYYLKNVDVENTTNATIKTIKGNNYTKLVCRTKVNIIPEKMENDFNFVLIVAIVGCIALLIIIGETIYIIFLKYKANRRKSINSLSNFSKKSEDIDEAKSRYCTGPQKKVDIKQTPVNPDRDSVIYEAPIIQTPEPPSKPAPPHFLAGLSTLLRSPKVDQNVGSDATLPVRERSLPRPDLDLVNRPPLPLPNEEVYEEMEPIEENTYEQPPVPAHTLPTKPTVAQKPLPAGKQPEPVMFKPKPPTAVKPQNAVQPPKNAPISTVSELEQVLMRRNVKVPVQTIPGPSNSKRPKSKPPRKEIDSRTHATHQEDNYYNQTNDSSDEDWNYEPLKPSRYYNENIYNNY